MTALKNFLGLIALASVLFSCQKEMSIEEGKAAPVEAQWEFTESGTVYSGKVDTSYTDNFLGTSSLGIEGSSKDAVDRQFVLQIYGSEIKTGNYVSPNCFFGYLENGVVMFETPPGASFQVTITSIDNEVVTGTFSGTARDINMNTRTITNGKFTARLSQEDGPQPEPEGDYLPLDLNSSWLYVNDDDNNETNTLAVTEENVDIEGKKYVKLTSDLGDELFFRKEGGQYFRHQTVDLGGVSSNNPSAEIMILDENLEAGEEWESEEFDVDLTVGIPLTVKVKIVSYISQKIESETFNGVAYNDLIEVTTDVMVSYAGMPYESNGSFTTTFARGVGVVKYYDIERDKYWSLKEYNP